MPTEPTPLARLVFCLAALAVVVYLNALPAGFTFDDEPDIVNNPAVTQGVDPVSSLASPLPPGDLYRPLTVFTFAINYALSGWWPLPFHAVNVVLHAMVTLLVFVLARRLFGSDRPAALAALLFAIHPVHTEAVTSLVGRAEVLGAAFGLIALLTADPLDAAASPTRRLALRLVSVAAFALALMSKESALTVLPLLIVYRAARRADPFASGVWAELRSGDWLPYALCAGLFLGTRFYVVTAVEAPLPLTPLNNILGFVPWSVRIRSALGVLWDYFGLLNVPLVLSADYSYNQVSVISGWLDVRFIAGLVVLLAGTGVAIGHRQASIRFATALPLVALALTSNLLMPIGTIKAERLLYLPSVGWALLVGYAFDRWLATRRYRSIAAAALCVLVAAFGARTWLRNWDWKNNATLYRSMVETAPDSAKSRYNFGVLLQQQFADELAVPEFRRAFATYPQWAEIALGIGIGYQRRGFTDRAVEWYTKALEVDPGFGKAHTNLCHVFYTHQRYPEAAAACRRGLRYEPTDANLLKGLGNSLIASGERDKGLAILRRALALNRTDTPLREYVDQLALASAGRGHDLETYQ